MRTIKWWIGSSVGMALLVLGCTNPVAPTPDTGPMRIDAGPMSDAGPPNDVGSDASAAPDGAVTPDAFTTPDAYVPPDAAGCAAGTVLVGATCTPIPTPRPIAPLSTATTTSQTPTFHWMIVAPATGGRVDVCADRACATVQASFSGASANSGQPAASLAPGVHFWRVWGTSGTAMSTSPSAVWEVFIPIHAASGGVDTSWGTVGDYNGDGIADPLIGADRTLSGGAAYVFNGGRPGGPTSLPSRTLDPGLGAGALFGFDLSSAGDVDGDGFADAIVGAQHGERALIYRGSATGLSTTGVALLGPDGAGASFGYSVAPAGDLDSDGYADVAVGAYTTGTGADTGAVHVFYGGESGIDASSRTTRLVPMVLHAEFGYCVASAGDVNADGAGDLVVSQSSASGGGNALVFLGIPSSGVSAAPLAPLTAPSSSLLGNALAAADFDGNGYADIVVADEAVGSYAGVVHVFLASSGGVATVPSLSRSGLDGAGASFGGRLSVGDVDGDGFADLAVSAHTAVTVGPSSGPGRIYVYRHNGGTILATTPSTTLSGTAGGFGLGLSISGDSNGDGFADLLIGETGASGAMGHAYIYRGSAAGVLGVAATDLPSPDGGEFGYRTY